MNKKKFDRILIVKSGRYAMENVKDLAFSRKLVLNTQLWQIRICQSGVASQFFIKIILKNWWNLGTSTRMEHNLFTTKTIWIKLKIIDVSIDDLNIEKLKATQKKLNDLCN